VVKEITAKALEAREDLFKGGEVEFTDLLTLDSGCESVSMEESE